MRNFSSLYGYGKDFRVTLSVLNSSYKFSTREAGPAPVQLAFDSYLTLKNDAKIERTNPLVISHGLFGHKQNWRGIAKAIQAELDNFVFVVDLRNHGESPHTEMHTYPAMSADLHEFIKREVLTRSRFKTIFLLGHSMGGKTVSEFALDKSKSSVIEKLIVEDVAPHRTSDFKAFSEYIQALKQVNLSQTRSQINQALKATISDDAVRGFMLTNLYKPGNDSLWNWRCNLESLEANLDHLFGFKVDTKKKADCPTLFISGQRSTYLTGQDRPILRRMFHRAEFEEIKEAGHWVHSEKPEQFLQTVLHFLKSGYFIY